MGVKPQPGADVAVGSETTAEGQPPIGARLPETPGWNVIVTLSEATAPQARRALRRWGRLHRTAYFHVLVMAVVDPDGFLHEFGDAVADTPGILNFIAHVFAAQRTFDFATVDEFEAKAREAALSWAPLLAGKRFHVRLHRRGLKGTLSTPNEERFLDDTLLEALTAAGTPGQIGFDDPDFVIHIETIDRRAGMALWSRADMQRFPFLSRSR
jgi:tRNA(Ser,Leu) C12 N-acetylase TAN1